MLKLKKIKILPLCPLFLALFSCGKKVEEKSSTVQGQTGANVAKEIVLVTSIEGSKKDIASFVAPRDGDFYLIPQIQATKGNAEGYSLKVYVNKVGNMWEFHCLYKGVTNSVRNQFTLHRCYDIDGLDLGLSVSNIQNFSFPLDQGKNIEMTIENTTTRAKTTARAIFQANWNQ